MYHKITDYYFGQFSCLYKEVHTYDKELEEFCLKNKSVIAFMMNMAEDIHGNNILKEYMSIVNRRNSHVNGYMISIQFSKIVDHVCKMYHVLKGRQKYIFRSAINNITKRKNWRGNAFMCMKDYGAKKNIGKIRIIHLIGQKVSFARRSIRLCMGILIWKERQYY